MIEELPSEVILAISSYLNFENKLALTTTCRRLYSLISKTCLFSKLNLLQNEKKAKDIIEKLKQNQYSGAQVKVLHVNMKKLPDELFFQLSTIFPNVNRVLSPETYFDIVKRNSRYSKGPMLDWIKTLEKYSLYHDWAYIVLVLNTTTFSQLKELVIGNTCEFEDRENGFDIMYFLKYIKHAPLLNKLTLDLCAIDLDFLEEIHSSCPYINSLRFDHVAIVMNEDAILQPITPAYLVSSFEIKKGYCCDKNGILLDYITHKYQHLRHLQLHFNDIWPHYEFERIYRSYGFEPFLFTVPDEDVSYIEEYRQDYESLRIDMRLSLEVYSVLGPKFLTNLPKTVKSFSASHHLCQ